MHTSPITSKWFIIITDMPLLHLCRARDRRMGRPIQSMTDPSNTNSSTTTTTPSLGTMNIGQSGLNYSPSDHQIAPQLLSQSPHSAPNPLMQQISIPQYKPNSLSPVVSFGQHSFNNVSSFSSPPSSMSPSRLAQGRNQDSNLISPLCFNSQKPLSIPQSIFNKSDAQIQSKLYNNSLFDNSDTISSSLHEEPLDLSFKTKSHTSGDSVAEDSFNSFESEVLNLSKKSNRVGQDIDCKDAVQGNVSLTMLQQQHDFDSSNLRNVLLNNGKLVDDLSDFSKVYAKINENGQVKSGRGRKRLYGADIEMNNSNDSNNNILKIADFETKIKSSRLSSPNKETKLNNGILSNANSPDHNQSEGLFTCDQCDKTFSKQSSLARHKYEHSGIYRYILGLFFAITSISSPYRSTPS